MPRILGICFASFLSFVSVPFLRKTGAQQLLKAAKHHYAICHDKIVNAVRGSNQDALETQYERLLKATDPHKNLNQTEFRRLNDNGTPLAKCVMKKKRRNTHAAAPVVVAHDKILLQEIRFVQNKLDEWKRNAKSHYDRRQNQQAAQRDGTGVECPCCCDEFAIGDMVACRDEGHLFCCGCLEAFAKNQIFGVGNLGVDATTKKPNVELKCFHSDGCNSGFDRACLDKALPRATIEKYDSMQFQIRYVGTNENYW